MQEARAPRPLVDVGLGLLGWAFLVGVGHNLYLTVAAGSFWLPVCIAVILVPVFVYPWLHLRLTGRKGRLLEHLGFRRLRLSRGRIAALLLLITGGLVGFAALPGLEAGRFEDVFRWVAAVPQIAQAPFQDVAWEAVPDDGWVATLMTFSLLPAFAEETLYRGYLRRVAFRALPTPVTYGLIAVLFSVAHGRPEGVVTLALFSLLMNLAVDLCDSVWAGILVHAGVNTLLIVPGLRDEVHATPWLTAGGLGLLLGLVLLARRGAAGGPPAAAAEPVTSTRSPP